MMSSDKGVSLNIGGGHMDPASLLLAAGNRRDDGFGSGNMLVTLLLAMGLYGRGGFGCGYGGAAAAGAAVAGTHEASFLQLLNKICEIPGVVAANAAATQAAVEVAADRMTANNNLQTQLMDSGFTSTKESIALNKEAMTAGFTNTNNNVTSGFTQLAKEVNCGFNVQNNNFNNYTRTLDMNLCQNFGKVFLQNSALKCAIDRLDDKVVCGFDKTNALIVATGDKIIAEQKSLAKDALLAEQAQEIASLKAACAQNDMYNNIIRIIGSGNGNGNHIATK